VSKWFFLVVVLAVSVPSANAGMTEADLFADVPVVNGATRLQQRATEVPVSVSIIDREMIRASGATEVAHLMRLVPGFQSYSVLGNQLGLSSRALSTDFPGHLEVRVNGRSVYEPAFSTVVWSSLGIDIKDIDYIEVIRGSNTPAYGSNAFSGAINIVTLDSLNSPEVSLRAVAGSIDTREFSASHAGSTKHFNYLVSVLSRENSGFPALDEPKTGPWPTHTVKDDMRTRQFRLQGLYTPTLDDEIRIAIGVGEDNLRLPENDVRGYHNREFDSHFQQVSWKHALDNGNVTLDFYHNYLSIKDDTVLGRFSELIGVPPALAGFPGQTDEVLLGDIRDGLSERYHLELQHTFDVAQQLQMVWGGAFRVDRLGSRFLIGDDDIISVEQYQLFANADWRFHPQWNMNAGVMLEHNSLVGTFASPRVGINYQWTRSQTVRLSGTVGKRTPSLLSVYQDTAVTFSDGTVIDQIGGTDGEANEERVDLLELGYLGYFLDGALSLDVRVFHERLRDARYTPDAPANDLDGEQNLWRNGLRWDTDGFEAQLQYRPSRKWLLSWQYAYLDLDGVWEEPGDPDDLGNHLPTHNTSLLLAYRPTPDWELSGTVYHTSKMEWTGGDEVDDITRTDLRLARQLRLGNWQGEMEVLVHNAFGDYVDYDDENIFERRVFLRVQFDLN
jgi:iron complex outermembrane receptor protein